MRIIMIVLIAVAGIASAGSWSDAADQDLHGYARALSLDLRGTVPTTSEMEAIEADGLITEERIDAWLSSVEFEEQVITQHREKFWNNLAFNLLFKRRLVSKSGLWYNFQRTQFTRGVKYAYCGDFAADVDSMNRPLTWFVNPDGSLDEGWVLVNPYWDPDNPIKVCAFDAQLTEVSQNNLDCSLAEGQNEPDCGCGPDLQWCLNTAIEEVIVNALEDDLSERVRSMLQENASYDELFVGNSMFVNGASAHLFRHLVPFDPDNLERPFELSELPEMDFLDENWINITLADNHDGVLTSAGWLLRHQTNRGRANRFYSAFLCKDFVPPEGGIVGISGVVTPSPDLTLREGCLGCHARLEPWSAYWGRWSEAAMVYRSVEDYPIYAEECAQCALTNSNCSDFCEDNYLIELSHPDESPYIGWLNSYVFLTEDKKEHPDIGPLGFVEQSINDGSFAQCSVSNAASWLLNWPQEDELALAAWSAEFDSNMDYRSVVKSIVSSPQYWRGQ